MSEAKSQFHKSVSRRSLTLTDKCGGYKDNTVDRLNIRVRLCSYHLSFHLKIQIPIKSIQVTVCESALIFMYTKKLTKKFSFLYIEDLL